MDWTWSGVSRSPVALRHRRSDSLAGATIRSAPRNLEVTGSDHLHVSAETIQDMDTSPCQPRS